MEALAGAEQGIVLPLVPDNRSAGHMTFVHAVLEGTQTGSVFVDDRANPAAAVVASYSGFFFALGAPAPGFVDAALPALAEVPVAEPPAIWATNDAWRATLAPRFSTSRERDEFLPPPSRPGRPDTPGGGLRLERDTRVIAAAYREALGEAPATTGQLPWLVEIWGGEEAFARHSFGVGVMEGERLLALCAACAIAHRAVPPEAEIEIWTDPDARRRGLAAAAGQAFMLDCHGRGMEPAWTCETQNTPSRALAERLGFGFLRRIHGFPLADLIA